MTGETSIKDLQIPNAPQVTEDSIATRHSLLNRLKNKEDRASWQDFFDTYWHLIYRVAVKAGLSHAEAQDVVQETVISVARKIDGFVYDPSVCSFKTWMLRLTRWRIIDRLRKQRREPERFHQSGAIDEQATQTATINRIPDPADLKVEENWDREWALNLYRAALEKTKRLVSPDHFQIYDLYVNQEMAALKVARLLRVNVALVYLAKHRVAKVLKREIENLKKSIDRRECA